MALDEFLDLPEDPELQFVVYESRLRQKMLDAIYESESTSFDLDQRLYYVTKIMAFHDAHGFNFLIRPHLIRGSEKFLNEFDDFTNEVTYWTTQIEVRHANRLRPISTIIKLTPEIRSEIQLYIAKIRDIVHEIQISEKKKEAIFVKLNALAAEVDCDRTKADAWTAFFLEIASASGQAAKELKPAVEITNSIGRLLGNAKEIGDKLVAIAGPAVRKMIEGPPKKLPPPQKPSPPIGDPDDEIPF